MTRRIGLFGGTFDPPHLGHLLVAEWVRDACGLDAMHLLVAGDPWMKQTVSRASVRLELVRLAVGDDPYLVADDREAHRSGATVTADTLDELHREMPEVSWTFVVGADAAASLPSWRRVHDALELAEFVVVGRPGWSLPDHELAHRLRTVEAPLVDLSSTTIRQRVRDGRSIRHLVPQAVNDLIGERGLYRPPLHG